MRLLYKRVIPLALAISVPSIIAAKFYLDEKKKEERIPQKWRKVGKIKKLCIYPLKSAHRIELENCQCDIVGLSKNGPHFQLRDRSFVVYDEETKKYFEIGLRKLFLVTVSVHNESTLAFDAPSMQTLYVKIPENDARSTTKISVRKNELFSTIDCGNEAASWFSRYITGKESGARLGYNPGNERRNINETEREVLGFYKKMSNKSTGIYQSLSSILIINQTSVDDLVSRISKDGNSKVTANNFRGNIIVDGTLPYEEDNWDWMKIGDVILRNVKDCTRCHKTTIDPEDGTMYKDREPLKTLRTYRKCSGPEKGEPIMGIHAEVKVPGPMSVGDDISVDIKEE